MVSFNRMMKGINAFLDHEILNKMGWQKWLVGSITILFEQNAQEVFESLKANTLVQMMGVIDGDMIDVDKLHRALTEQASKGNVSVDLPLGMGRLTLTQRDVENLHTYIANA